jgi:antitoxin component YwqK of YwqJK toxin-antitoxin module
MQPISIILLLTFLFGCKAEYRETIELYPSGKKKVEYVYPDKDEESKYTIISYYENGQVSFKGGKEIVSSKTGGQWRTPDGNWITPN